MKARRWAVHGLKGQKTGRTKICSEYSRPVDEILHEAEFGNYSIMGRPVFTLMRSVLEQAIKDVQECGQFKVEALAWMKRNEIHLPFSCAWICQELGLDRKAVIRFAEREDIAIEVSKRKRLRRSGNKDRQASGVEE